MASEAKYQHIARMKTLVLDVLKPHLPHLPEFATFMSKLDGVNKVDISLVEIDEKTESLKAMFNGSDINFDALKKAMEKQGAVIHSVDQVIVEK